MRSLVQLLLTILLNACWQIAVVTLFAACCSWLLRGTAAWCRHLVWVAAMVISLCLPIISALNKIEPPPKPEAVVTHSQAEEPFTRPSELPALETTQPAATTLDVPAVEPARQPDLRVPISVNKNLATLLVAFFAASVLYRGFKLLRAWRRTAAIMRAARPAQVSPRAAAIIAKCQTAIGVKNVRVVCSNSVHLPITAGVFNPLIILPEQLLSEADADILLSAIGHELVHVARRDYILNLVYEFIYLPLSFHPAAALLRRRIRQTRELCCDELVAGKLLTPELYARSLVRLVGSVPLGRLAPDTTIGITDADVLEVRIMSLLKTSKFSTRRNTFLLIAACLLMAAPCVAAAAIAPEFEIYNPELWISQQQDQDREALQKLERAREELQSKEREFAEQVRKSSTPQGAELEKLRRMETELREASVRFSREQESQHLKETEKGLDQVRERLAQIITTYPGDEARMREAKEQLAQLQRSLPETQERSRELREQLARIEKEYPNANAMADYREALRRAQVEMAQQKEALSREQREKIDEKMKLAERVFEDQERKREARDKIELKMRDAEEKIRNNEKIRSKEYQKLIRKDVDKHIRKEMEEAGLAGRTQEQAELTQLATMSMDRAIQIANSQYPGKVLSCSLGRQKDGQVFYRLVIINGEGDKSAATHVWVSATDGRILKTEHE
jgi:beta-lactamase regulating signal transducer with metallopeptidase domain/uncharacterized membrane protein YkoI